MNLNDLKTKAGVLRQQLDIIDRHINTMHSDVHAFLGTGATAQAPAATPATPAKAAAPVKRRKRRVAVAKAVTAKPSKVLGRVPASQKKAAPKKSARTAASPRTAPIRGVQGKAAPASAPVSTAGVDSDFDALS